MSLARVRAPYFLSKRLTIDLSSLFPCFSVDEILIRTIIHISSHFSGREGGYIQDFCNVHFTYDYYLPASAYSTNVINHASFHLIYPREDQTTYHALAEYSNNNRFIAFPFLPEASCNGVLPSESFTPTSAPWLRRNRAIWCSRRCDAKCKGVSWSLFRALTSAPRSSNCCTKRTA